MEQYPTSCYGQPSRQFSTPPYFGHGHPTTNYQQVNSGFFPNQYDGHASHVPSFQSDGLTRGANRNCFRYPSYPHNSISQTLTDSSENVGGKWWNYGAQPHSHDIQTAHPPQPHVHHWSGRRDRFEAVTQEPAHYSTACHSVKQYLSYLPISVNQTVSTGNVGGAWWNNSAHTHWNGIQRAHPAQPHMNDSLGHHYQSAVVKQEPVQNSVCHSATQYSPYPPNSIDQKVSTGSVGVAWWNSGAQSHWDDIQKTHPVQPHVHDDSSGCHSQSAVVKQEPVDYPATCESVTHFSNTFQDTKFVLECSNDTSSPSYPYQQITNRDHQNSDTEIQADDLGKASASSQNAESNPRVSPYGCIACEERFDLESEMTKHFYADHELICDFCGKTFNDDGSFKEHYRIHVKKTGHYLCMLCGKGFDDEEKLRQHQDQHIKLLKCKECNLVFLERKVLDLHFKIRHRSKKKSADNSTSFGSKTGKELDVKKLMGYGTTIRKRPKRLWAFKCYKCGHGFDEEGKYNFHMKYRCIYREFMCEICTDVFVNRVLFENHMVNAHSETHPFRCGWCKSEARFVCCKELARHVWHKHVKPTVSPVIHTCYCGKKFTSDRQRIKHRVSHTGVMPHSCDICGKSFLTLENLTVHRRIHTGEKPFVCTYCGQGFRKRMVLVYHERLHSGVRPCTCDICGKSFVESSSYGRHMRKKHGAKLKVRPTKC